MLRVSANARRMARALLGPTQMEEAEVLRRTLVGDRSRVLIDVGAHHGTVLRPFAQDGWEVHAFEPDPINREILEQSCGRMENVRINPVAVSDKPGQLVLYRSEQSSGISSLTPFTASHAPDRVVEVTTLSEYLMQRRHLEISLLKIDVEGYERNVLWGFPWDEASPRAVMLEFEDAKTRALGYGWTDLASELTAHGYRVMVSEWFPVSAYGVVHRWRGLHEYPTKLRDEMAWGNLLAVRASDVPCLRAVADEMVGRLRRRRRAEAVIRRLRTASHEPRC